MDIEPNKMDNIFKKFYRILLKDKKHLMLLIGNISMCKWVEGVPQKSEEMYRTLIENASDAIFAEESLLLERNRLFNVFEAMGDGIYIVDQNHYIEYLNPILKNDSGSYNGRKCYEYFYDREEVCPWCKNDEVFAGKTMSGEWYYFKNNRTYNFMDMPLKNPDGSISKLEILRDITEQKKIEAYKNVTHEISRILLDGKNEKTLDTALEELGKESDSSRSYIFELDHTKKLISNTYEWVNPDELKSEENPDGIEAQIENLQDLPMDIFPKFMEMLIKNEVLNVSNIYEYDFDEPLINSLKEQGIKSILLVPLYYREKLNGFIGFDECKRYRKWDDVTVEFLINNAHVIASFIERERAQKELQQQREEQQIILDSVPAMIFYKDKEDRFISVNETLAKTFKISKEEIAGKTASEISPGQGKDYWENDKQVIATGQPKRKIIEPIETPEGTRWIQADKIPCKDNEGNIIGIIGFAVDITELKKAEEEVKVANQYVRNLISSSLDMIISVDKKRRIVEFNIAAQKTFGYGRDEIIGKYIEILYADTKEGVKVYENSRKSGQFTGEILNKRKNGELFPSFISASILQNENGEFLGIMGVSRDITERKKLETQFIQAQKMESVGRLAGGIAHDFNNILTVILGNAQLALMSLTQEDPIIENIMEIKNSADRATSLTRQLLAFSRRQIIEPRVIILNNTILEMDKMFSRLIGENIELVAIPAENLWPVKIDPGQIEQVLTNLVVNACDAMPKGGKLTIETVNVTLDEGYTQTHAGSKPGDYVMVAVSDTGVGMDEETMSHIFEPFFTTKELGKGTGLGLSTCYGIIKQNGGNIWTYSEQGFGTSFKIYFPREFGETNSSIKIKNNSPKGTETILIVEDESKVRQVTSGILRNKGYTIYEAANGEEALRVAEKDVSWNIHLLITDVIMPRMSGKELSEHFSIKNPDIKVLFVSGYPDNSIVHHEVLEPGIAFLQKPFSSAALVWKVRQILDE